MREAEVGHGARRRSYIERVSGGDENDAKLIALRVGEQGLIVERKCAGCYTAGAASEGDGKRMTLGRESLETEIERLCATARWCYGRGWVPATSGNFSVRVSDGRSERLLITPSGMDKGALTAAHLLEIDKEGQLRRGNGKPSAETALHMVIYRARPETGAILHVHTVWNTLISGRYAGRESVPIEGYEILKGLVGVATHEHVERIPLIENTQDYAVLAAKMGEALTKNPEAHGVLLSRHGLYTWGQSVAEARRHLEALEFLFEVEGRRLGGAA
jgi:methylthioribulose-1-phosphate dehydratase